LKKNRLFLIIAAVIIVLAVAFYITKSWHMSVLSFALIWLIAIILIRLILTPLVVMIVRARDEKKARREQEESQKKDDQ
jgi:Na+/melibiose symporter-like transporter